MDLIRGGPQLWWCSYRLIHNYPLDNIPSSGSKINRLNENAIGLSQAILSLTEPFSIIHKPW